MEFVIFIAFLGVESKNVLFLITLFWAQSPLSPALPKFQRSASVKGILSHIQGDTSLSVSGTGQIPDFQGSSQ